MSDKNLKQAITKMEDALSSLRELDTSDDEVRGHRSMSDENLKQTITSLSDALEALKRINTQPRS
jgi:hypothetical protein